MSLVQSPQRLFEQADDLIAQAVVLRKEARDLAEKATLYTTRAISLENAAATLQHTAALLDHDSRNVFPESAPLKHKELVNVFQVDASENISDQASELHSNDLATKKGSASTLDIDSSEARFLALPKQATDATHDDQVYVEGLHQNTTKTDLLQFFSDYEVTICNMPQIYHQKIVTPRFAFVTFRDASAARHAVETLSGKSILGNQVSIRMANDWSAAKIHEQDMLEMKRQVRANQQSRLKRPASQLEDEMAADVPDRKHPRLQNDPPEGFLGGFDPAKGYVQTQADESKEVIEFSATEARGRMTTMTTAFGGDFIPLEDLNNEDNVRAETNAIEEGEVHEKEDESPSHMQAKDLTLSYGSLTRYQLNHLEIAVAHAERSADAARTYLMEQYLQSQSRLPKLCDDLDSCAQLTEIVGPCCLVVRLPPSVMTTRKLRIALDAFGRILMWKDRRTRKTSESTIQFKFVLLRYSNEFSCRMAYEAGRESGIVPGLDLFIFKPIR